MATEITSEVYQQLLNESKPLVIDFSATWCGPCKKLAPIIDELAEEYAGRVAVYKCDVDHNEELAAQYGVRNIPTVVFIKDGKEVDRTVGAMPKAALVEKVDALL